MYNNKKVKSKEYYFHFLQKQKSWKVEEEKKVEIRNVLKIVKFKS